MNRQSMNVVTTLLITAFAGFGLTASAQDPSSYQDPKGKVEQPVMQQPVTQQPVTQQPVTQQPVAQQPVAQQPVMQQPVTQTGECVQPTSCYQAEIVTSQTSACVQPVAFSTIGYGANQKDLVKRIERGADRFRRDFNDSLSSDCLGCAAGFGAGFYGAGFYDDNGFWRSNVGYSNDNWNNFDAYKDTVREFERATDRLRKDYGDDCDVSFQVNEVLRLAGCVSALVDPCTLCPEAVAEWNSLRADLDALAAAHCTTVAWQQPVSLLPQPACFAQPAVSCPVACPVASPVASPVIQNPVIQNPVIQK